MKQHTDPDRVTQRECPRCGALNDWENGAETVIPKPGDFMICLDCFELAVFGPDLEVSLWPQDKPVPDNIRKARDAMKQRWN